MDFSQKAIKVFDLDEGKGKPGRPGQPYLDSKGYWTIGRGHFIGKDLTALKLPDFIIDALFFHDISRCIKEAEIVFGKDFFESLPDARKLAIITLFFTMGGTKVTSQFDETIQVIQRREWDNVARRVFTWQWARDVDPKQRPGEGRDDRVAYMFKTGEFPPEYGI
jgi:GH24 family phage-related lysozyme (muramidase)